MAKQVRYGMVGGDVHAFIGEVHRKALNFDTRVELVAGCFSKNAERNMETADAYGLDHSRVYATYADMAAQEAAREDGIDFVSIVTPNYMHYQIAKAFLLHGINVVCEKPLCFEVEEAQELRKLAQEKNLLFGVMYSYTGYAMSKVMKEMVAEGKIGNIATVNAEYVQDWLLDDLSPDEGAELNLSVWRKDPKISGISNCVGDIGTHIENYVHYITGLKIKRLLATTNKYGHPLELNANILLEYENGVNGAYWCSQIASGRTNGLTVRIYGDRGGIEWEQQYPDYVRYTPKGEPTQILSRGNGYIHEKAGAYSRIPTGHPEGLYVGFANLYKDYVTAIIKHRNGEDVSGIDFPRIEDGINGVKFIHAVIDSANSDAAWVTL